MNSLLKELHQPRHYVLPSKPLVVWLTVLGLFIEVLSPLNMYKCIYELRCYVMGKGAKNLLCKANIERHIQYREKKDKAIIHIFTDC